MQPSVCLGHRRDDGLIDISVIYDADGSGDFVDRVGIEPKEAVERMLYWFRRGAKLAISKKSNEQTR